MLTAANVTLPGPLFVTVKNSLRAHPITSVGLRFNVVGVTVTLSIVVATVQVRLAGLASVLPAGSVALTLKVCAPLARLL
jgi:hypothetical protein